MAGEADCAYKYQANTDDVQACADQLSDKGTEECAIANDISEVVCEIREARIVLTSPDHTVVDKKSSYWYAGTYFRTPCTWVLL